MSSLTTTSDNTFTDYKTLTYIQHWLEEQQKGLVWLCTAPSWYKRVEQTSEIFNKGEKSGISSVKAFASSTQSLTHRVTWLYLGGIKAFSFCTYQAACWTFSNMIASVCKCKYKKLQRETVLFLFYFFVCLFFTAKYCKKNEVDVEDLNNL